jgi:plastocyanin
MADGRWNSGALSEGAFRFRFDSPGSYPYFCDPHSEVMRGLVVVSAEKASETHR